MLKEKINRIGGTHKTSIILATIILVSVMFIWFRSGNQDILIPRTLDSHPRTYLVHNNASEEIVYVAYHINTAGDVFAPREFGLDLFVQNADKGYKQTVDSCKDVGSGAVDLTQFGVDETFATKSVVCDNKLYTTELNKGKILFYRHSATSAGPYTNLVTSIPVSLKAKTIVFVNSYELYSDNTKKTMSILENVY